MIDKNVNIEDLRVLAQNGVNRSTYTLFLESLVYRHIPSEVKIKLLKDDNDTSEENVNKLTFAEAEEYLKDLLPQIITENEFNGFMSRAFTNAKDDLLKLYDLFTIDSIQDATREVGLKLIAEAETVEEIGATTKKLGEILNKENIPNVLQAITATITKEIKKGNEEMDKIEDQETKLVLSTDPNTDGDDLNALYNTPIEGNKVKPDDSNIDGDESQVSTSVLDEGNPEGDNKENKDKTKSEENQEDTSGTGISGIEGENGEIYAESIRRKYAEALDNNLVYRTKNAMSKYVYQMVADGKEITDKIKNVFAWNMYVIITFGYVLDKLSIVPLSEFGDIIEKKLTYNKEA